MLQFELEDLYAHEQAGLVKSSKNAEGYTVWCYTQKAVVEQAWDEITLSARGLVYAPDGTLVSRPFRKFFNWDQPQAVVETGPFLAFDKYDGTLIVVGEHEGRAIVSTKGSFDTWHSEAARELLKWYVPPKGLTVMFELIHPNNRIVIDYGDLETLVLLGAVDNDDGYDFYPHEVADSTDWHGEVAVARSFNFQSMLQTIANPESGKREDGGADREGFVVLWRKPDAPGNRVKLKFSLYVQLHGVYTGLTNRRVWECLRDRTLDALYELAPDELHEAIAATADEVLSTANTIGHKAQHVVACAYDEIGLPWDDLDEQWKWKQDPVNRRNFAAYVTKHSERPITGLAFKLYDEKRAEFETETIVLARPEESRFVGSAGLG